MTQENRRRCFAYPCVALVLATLVYAGGFRPFPEGEPDLGTMINGADILAKVGAHDKAIQECEKVLERDPGNLQAHLILAFSHDCSDRYEDALETYERASGLCTDDEDLALHIRLSIADLHRRYERPQEAILETRNLEDSEGCLPRAKLVRGLSEQALGNFDLAVETFREVTSGPHSSAEGANAEKLAELYLAHALLAGGRYPEAEEAFTRLAAGSADPGHPFHLAIARAASGDDEGMYEALEATFELSRGLLRNRLLEEPAFVNRFGEARFEALLDRVFEEPVATS